MAATVRAVCLVALALCCHAQLIQDTWVSFSKSGTAPKARDSHTAVIDKLHGLMVVFGGKSGDHCFKDLAHFNWVTSEWVSVKSKGNAPTARHSHTAVVTPLNTMIIFGGKNGSNVFNDVAVYDFVSRTWLEVEVTGEAPIARYGHAAVITSHAMYVYGGVAVDGTVLNDVAKFDYLNNKWVQFYPHGTPPAKGRAYHSAVTTINNDILFFGGSDGATVLNQVLIFSYSNETWLTYHNNDNSSAVPSPRRSHSAVYTPVNSMIVFGGVDSTSTELEDVYKFDALNYEWVQVSSSGSAASSRHSHSAVATPVGSMIVFGGFGDNATLNDLHLFILASTPVSIQDDGNVLVVLCSLVGTGLLIMCFALDWLNEKNAEERARVARIMNRVTNPFKQGASVMLKPFGKLLPHHQYPQQQLPR